MLNPRDKVAPLGKLIIGSVFDCNKAALERSLKFYDPQLYIKWNPKKKKGWGVWEIRRRPDHKAKVYQGMWNGSPLYTTEYVENNLVNHVLDVDVLTYDILGRLKAMDAWNQKNWTANLEYTERVYREDIEKKAREELRYNIKQYRREWREFAQLVSQGVNPGQILKGRWG